MTVFKFTHSNLTLPHLLTPSLKAKKIFVAETLKDPGQPFPEIMLIINSGLLKNNQV